MLRGFGTRMIRIGLLMVAGLTIAACGGGGGGGGGQDSPTPASIDAAVVERSAALTLVSRDLSDLNENLEEGPVRNAAGASVSVAGQILSWTRARILAATALERSGAMNGPADCDSGQGRISFTWDGPQSPAEACAVQNLSAVFEFMDCQEGHTYKNGKVIMRMTGSACAPTAISLQFNDFTIEDESSGALTTMSDLRISYTDLGYSGGEIIRMTVELDGDVVASSVEESFSMQFDSYVLGLIKAPGQALSLTIHGTLTGPCLDGWVTVETVSPLVFSNEGGCPVEGTLKFTGNGEATMTFGSGGVDINVPGLPETHFDSCAELPDNC